MITHILVLLMGCGCMGAALVMFDKEAEGRPYMHPMISGGMFCAGLLAVITALFKLFGGHFL